MKKYLILCLISVCFILGVTKGVRPFSFTPFTVPGAGATFGNGINNKGVVVGAFETGDVENGYVRSTGGFFSTVNFPTATPDTELRGIDDKGVLVGSDFNDGIAFIAK